MSIRTKAGVAAVAALALLAGMTGVAHAAPTPPWEPDPASVGSLTFYDAAGQPVTGGSINDAPFATYVRGSAPGRAGDTLATLFGYLPKNGVPIGAWSGEAISGSTPYPSASAPAPLNGSLPLATLTAGDGPLSFLQGDFPNTATDAYQGLYQLRLVTSGPGGQNAAYQSADIQITGDTWSLVYPAPVAQATTTTLTASPASPQNAGTAVTLTAAVSPAGAAGTVQFVDGATNIGGAVTVAAGSASITTSTLSVTSHQLTAVFTPSSPASYAPSTSAAVPFVISAVPATPTSVALAVNTGTSTAFAPVVLNATVTPTAAPGAVTFSEGANVLGTVPTTAGAASLTTSALAQGSHTITATFNATDPALFTSSSATSSAFTLGAPQYAPDAQTITAQIAAGTLVISTPYTPTNPLDLGALALNTTATGYSGSAPFTGITVTDTRAGNLPWTVSAVAGNLTNGGAGVINGQNVGLTGLVADPIANNALTATSVSATDNPAASPAVAPGDGGSAGLGGSPHPVLHAANGLGSIAFHGVLTLNAPTSSPAGTYTGTVTFTIG